MSVKLTHHLLVPVWIAGFGGLCLAAPPLGVAASLGLFVVGVGVVPAALIVMTQGGRGLPLIHGHRRRG